MAKFDIERHLEASQRRRMAAEDRFLGRSIERENAADAMIGVLIREGKEIFYVHPQGGKYREGSRSDLIAFLVRNRYV